MAHGVATMKGELHQLRSRMELCSRLLSDKLSLESTWEEHLDGAYDSIVLQALIEEKDLSKQEVLSKPKYYREHHWPRLRRWWRPRLSAYMALHEEFLDLAERRDAVKELNERFALDCERLRGQISELRNAPVRRNLTQRLVKNEGKCSTSPTLNETANQIGPYVNSIS